MISVETMKHRARLMNGTEFPLVGWRGTGRIVGSDDDAIDVMVRGVRVSLAWDRLRTTWLRFLANHTLTVDELGGGPDAVAIVSLFAFFQAEDVEVVDAAGLLALKEAAGRPVHQHVDVSRPLTRAVWERQLEEG